MYQKVSTDMNFAAREDEVMAFWKQNRIVQKCLAPQPQREPFSFYDGPPTANGMPHIGHLITRSIKDLFPRYKRMRGYDVLSKAGWDTHGLPVELEVEKQLGLDGKEQIEAYGVEPFIKKCKESVWKYKGEWESMSERIAFWADMENPYITYENDYIESVWWSLKTIFDKGLLYRGHKVVPYCPRCGTALSSHEVAQGYQDVTEQSVFVRFPVEGEENLCLLAWTTTPWTLPSNVALCVNPKENYAYAKGEDGMTYILAKALVPTLLGENAIIVKTVKGEALVGLRYKPLFDFQQKLSETCFSVAADGYVTLTDGSGIVHIAPAFGEDDSRVARSFNLPFVQLVDTKGRMDEKTPWGGVFCKDADPLIVETLRNSGLLFKVEEYAHNYPFCWRCDTPLLYYARSTWFIRMTEVREQLIASNRSVNWLPDNIREGRMGNFVENVIDWGLSRERYWGTPLPIWTCECGHVEAVGGIEDLKKRGAQLPADLELHKPYIDRITFPCPKCGNEMRRVPEVIDCWYDSGSMPFAQFHYPFENEDLFLRFFPAQFISEAVDQTRGWFYTLLAISTCLFEKSSFENCIVLGHVQDKDGQKMSKHKGNVINPWDVLGKQGADAVRWYFFTASAPWLPSRFYHDAVSEAQRKFMGTLWNTYAFYILYADIDAYSPFDPHWPEPSYSLMDRWVLSKLNALIDTVVREMDGYHVTEAARSLGGFVDELSNWYVRRCRERFWGGERTADKAAAYHTLFTVLESMSRLCAPFVPFLSESIYQNLVRSVNANAPESVHLCDFPVADKTLVDTKLIGDMDNALSVVTLGRAARNAAKIKNRQPLSRMMVQGMSMPSSEVASIILDELNIKALEITEDAASYIAYAVKPQLKTLGPKYGKLLPKIADHLKQADGTAVVRTVSRGGAYTAVIEGEDVSLVEEDLLISTVQREGFAAQSDGTFSVVLDLALSAELIAEGLVREFVSKLQNLRKETGFEVTDHIDVVVESSDEGLLGVLEANARSIMADVLAQSMKRGAGGTALDINGIEVLVSIKKV
jgi:isoleucyl-tRNA synthetase